MTRHAVFLKFEILVRQTVYGLIGQNMIGAFHYRVYRLIEKVNEQYFESDFTVLFIRQIAVGAGGVRMYLGQVLPVMKIEMISFICKLYRTAVTLDASSSSAARLSSPPPK